MWCFAARHRCGSLKHDALWQWKDNNFCLPDRWPRQSASTHRLTKKCYNCMRDKTVPFVPLWEAVHPFNRPLTPHFRLPPTKGNAYHDCCATSTLCVVPDWFWQHRVQEYDKALQYWRIIYAPSSAEGEGGDGSGFVGGSQRKPVRATTGNNLEVAREIRRDPVLSRVQESIVKGWSTLVGGDKP